MCKSRNCIEDDIREICFSTHQALKTEVDVMNKTAEKKEIEWEAKDEIETLYGDFDIQGSLLSLHRENLNNKDTKPRKRAKSKPKKRIRDRYDSVYRSLLRRFRKFYNQDFDKSTRFKALKRYRGDEFFIQCVTDYATRIFNEVICEDLVYNLANLIYPNLFVKHLQNIDNPQSKQETSIPLYQEMSDPENNTFNGSLKYPCINDTLLNFSFSKMESLLSLKSYSTFFLYFASQVNNLPGAESEALGKMTELCNTMIPIVETEKLKPF